jgi:hypothetical protein
MATSKAKSKKKEVTEITLTKNDDNDFTLRTDAGEIINYEDRLLINALEDIVYKFRGRKPKLVPTTLDQSAINATIGSARTQVPNVPNTPQQNVGAPQQQQKLPFIDRSQIPQRQNPYGDQHNDQIVSNRQNGGLGPQMAPDQNINGFGAVQ